MGYIGELGRCFKEILEISLSSCKEDFPSEKYEELKKVDCSFYEEK